MEREKFEGTWKKAFDKAEIGPSENVWTNVELEIEKSKGVKLQRKLFFFQLLAAALVVFAIGLSVGVFVLNQTSDQPGQMAAQQLQPRETISPSGEQVEQTLRSSTDEAEINSTKGNNNPIAANLQQRSGNGSADYGNTIQTSSAANFVAENPGVTSLPTDKKEEFNSAVLKQRTLPAIVANKKVELNLKKVQEEADPVALMMARLERRELEVKESAEKGRKDRTRNEKLWTALGFAAGTFNAIASNSGVSPAAASNTPLFNSRANTSDLVTKASIANQQAKASGIAYSAGVSVGTKLAKRWVLQGGVNYLTQSSEYTSQTAVSSADFTSFRPASISEFGALAEGDAPAADKLVTTVPYNVNNNLRYLSIPLQAGYLVINKQFGLQLNAGIATDLFLQNTVLSNVDNMERSTRQRGDDSPYRSVNLSGIAGTELSYRFGQHYRVAFNPGVRYPLNTIYKTEIGVESAPFTFDVGLRLRYIFN